MGKKMMSKDVNEAVQLQCANWCLNRKKCSVVEGLRQEESDRNEEIRKDSTLLGSATLAYFFSSNHFSLHLK